MSRLLFVVVVSCVFGAKVSDCLRYTQTDCPNHSPLCKWEPGYEACMIPCNQNIIDKEWGNENRSVAYVDLVDGDDTDDGSSWEHALNSIEQVKHCYGHFTTMHLAANESGGYDLTPPANLSQFENESDIPWFYIEGENQETTVIEVKNADYDPLNVVGLTSTSVICYVNQALFTMSNITVDVISTDVDKTHSTLLWIHGSSSEVRFENVMFKGPGFPKHVFIHTGGDFYLTDVQIAPGNNILPGNIIYWYGKVPQGSCHGGSLAVKNFAIAGPSNNITYTYTKSLFEQVVVEECELKIILESSTFKNIKWDDNTGPGGLKRQKNEDVPVGLILTVSGMNTGQVQIIDTVFEGLDVSKKPFAAPLAIASVPKNAESSPLFKSLTFASNTGNSAGAIAANANYSVFDCAFEKNKPYDLAALVDGVVATLDQATKDRGLPTTDSRMHIAGEEDNKLPIYAVAIIIAVGVVVVAAIVVIVACAVYYRNKKYSSLSDEEYDESSSSSLKSSEKENEMDSA